MPTAQWRSLLYYGPVYTRTGYGTISRSYIRSLHEAGVPIKVRAINWTDAGIYDKDLRLIRELENQPREGPFCALFHSIPAEWMFSPEIPAVARINISVFETDRVPATWVPLLNRFDQVWVPTEFHRLSYIRSGVDPSLVHVIPFTHLWLSEEAPSPSIAPSSSFRFLNISEFTPRKHLDLLLEAYFQEFSAKEPVELYLKVTFPQWGGQALSVATAKGFYEMLARLQHRYPARPPIIIDETLGSFADLNNLISAAQVYVSCDCAGYNLPVIESMACCRPVITVDWGGASELVQDERGFLIQTGPLVPVSEEAAACQPLYRGHKWPEITSDAIRRALRAAFSASYDDIERMGKAARRFAECSLHPALVAQKMISALEALPARAPNRRAVLVSTKDNGQKPARPDRGAEPCHKPAILWGGSIFDYSGYSRLSREAVLALDRLNADIHIEPYARDERFLRELNNSPSALRTWRRLMARSEEKGVYVCFHPPVLWNGTDVYAVYRRRHPSMTAYVGITMFETDRLPAGWAEACNQMDEVWVPSTFNLESFARAGVNRDILRVIPFGLDLTPYDRSKVRPLEIPGRRSFVFLSTFQWNKRKGWDILLKAYISAFDASDDVCLVLRTYPDRFKVPPIQQRIYDFIKSLGRTPEDVPPIITLDQFISDKDMPSLYAAADAFVLPSRGEGWGIPYMEAMAMGLPVIATRWSGHLDFMNNENAYLIDVDRLGPVHPEQTQENPYYTPDQLWAEPSVASTASLMQKVVDDSEAAKAKGSAAEKTIKQHWRSERTAGWILERVAAILESKRQRENASSRFFTATPTSTSNPQVASMSGSPADPEQGTAVIWHAPLLDPSGYADEARQFVLGLDSTGILLKAVNIEWSSKRANLSKQELLRLHALAKADLCEHRRFTVSVFHIFPPHFRRIEQAHYHIGRTMFETDRIPESWVRACNEMDEIWVPSSFNVETFAASGVDRAKLVKMPGAIKLDAFSPNVSALRIPGRRRFNFLSVFDWHLRKGWDLLLEAFVKEFLHDDDVGLVLKVWSSSGRTARDIRRQAAEFLKSNGLAEKIPSNIIFIDVDLGESEMASLYRAADAFVLPTHGEGWGRPFMEAMAMGLPVIATRWSGQLEFMNDENSYLIDCDIIEVPESAWREVPAFRGHRWAQPSGLHLRSLMREVVENRDVARKKGTAAREHIMANYNRDVISARVKHRIDEIRSSCTAETRKSHQTFFNMSSLSTSGLAVVWEGSQFVYHSLALVNRELCIRLAQRAGIDLSIVPFERHEFGAETDSRFQIIQQNLNRNLGKPADVYVRHYWPPNLNPPVAGRWVLIQPWEFGSIPKTWIEAWRDSVDDIWAPSSYVRECYLRSGMPADRVHIVPNGVDVGKFCPGMLPMRLKTRKQFKFLFVGGTIWRKGIDVLLQAYGKAFSSKDDVCLVIKDIGTQSFYRGQTAQELIAKFAADPQAPEIEYVDRTLGEHEMAGLYAACDCLVHPYRGEGFGLPIAEAMSCELPVIVTGHGAALDFCDPSTSFLISAREVRGPEKRVGSLETVDYPWWAEPDVDHLISLMRLVVQRQEEARAKGRAARLRIVSGFTWEQSAGLAVERLREIAEQPIRRFATRCSRSEPAQLLAQLEAQDRARLQRRWGDLQILAECFCDGDTTPSGSRR